MLEPPIVPLCCGGAESCVCKHFDDLRAVLEQPVQGSVVPELLLVAPQLVELTSHHRLQGTVQRANFQRKGNTLENPEATVVQKGQLGTFRLDPGTPQCQCGFGPRARGFLLAGSAVPCRRACIGGVCGRGTPWEGWRGQWFNAARGPGFRRGAATWAKQVGIPDEDIQLLGRWKSDAYKRYIEVLPEHIFGVSRRLQTPSFFPGGPPGLHLRRPQALSDSRDTPDMPGPTL